MKVPWMQGYVHCNTLQHTTTHCNTTSSVKFASPSAVVVVGREGTVEAGVNSYQHTATHCNALQHTATHCNATSSVKFASPSAVVAVGGEGAVKGVGVSTL